MSPKYARRLAALFLLGALAAALHAEEMPRLARQGGRYSLIVDGRPFFELGAQVANSSGWPERLATLWPVAEAMHVNTLEVPVYWQQLEPSEGSFDFSLVDGILAQARQHHVRLVLLWFGTWKNGKSNYAPEWVKENPRRFPRVYTREGQPIDVLSPNSPANLAADEAAFAALMGHLKQTDGTEHTVILVQVENESGILGSVRDFSPAAQKLFESAVPAAITAALHTRSGARSGTWRQVFGADADEAFAAYSVASYINQVAGAGKKQFPLPMYVNNWLKSPRGFPIVTVPGVDYPSGGPTSNMLDIWKAAAPNIDILAPDIYVPNTDRYVQVMRQFHRPDNPLFIPETDGFGGFPNSEGYARNLFLAIGEGAIGFSPFGLDGVSLGRGAGSGARAAAGASAPAAANLEAEGMAENYRLLGSFEEVLAQLQFAGKIQTAVEEPGLSERELKLGGWDALVSFPPSYDPPARFLSPEQSLHMGRVLIAPLGPDEFLVAGIGCRVQFRLPPPSPGKYTQLLRIEEGHYDGAEWKFERLWNGDEADYGLNFRSPGTILHVKLGTY